MRKSLHIIKGCFYKLTIIIISADDSIMYTNFGKVFVVLEMSSVILSQTKI